MSQPAPPSSRSESAKMYLEVAAAREGPGWQGESGQGNGRERKRRARRERCKLRGLGRRRPRRAAGRARTRGGSRAQARTHRAPRRATPPAPRPRVPFGTDLPAGRGRGRHSHNAPGRAAAAVAAASATASGRRWRKAERRTWTPSVLTSRRCSKPRSGKGTPGRERGRGARGGPRLAESWAGATGWCRRLVTGADRSSGGRRGSRFWGQRLDRRRGPGLAVGGARPELRGSGGRGSRGSRSSSLRQCRSHFGPWRSSGAVARREPACRCF